MPRGRSAQLALLLLCGLVAAARAAVVGQTPCAGAGDAVEYYAESTREVVAEKTDTSGRTTAAPEVTVAEYQPAPIEQALVASVQTSTAAPTVTENVYQVMTETLIKASTIDSTQSPTTTTTTMEPVTQPPSPAPVPPQEPSADSPSARSVTDTPIYTGGLPISAPTAGLGMMRGGMVARVDGYVYGSDALAPFKKDTAVVKPSSMPHVLSNPHRKDGTALNAHYAWPENFTGHVPVYTEGNWWPFVGKDQPQPPHSDLAADSGLFFRDGKLVDPVAVADPLVVPGETGAFVVNKADVSVLITSGSYPGNEQPGQVMTPVNPGETKPMPIPPLGWFPDGSGTPRVPELYASVGGLDPMDAPGWHKSGATMDYGTPGFCYTFGGRYTEMLGNQWLFAGFNGNEGYHPPISGDCMYGVALYVEDEGKPKELVAITDLNTSKQDLCAIPRFNPQVNSQQGLSAFPATKKGGVFTYVLHTHADAQNLMTETGWCSGSNKLTHWY
jgi:hypothetical protein